MLTVFTLRRQSQSRINLTVQAGNRSLTITTHAAQRMAERGVTAANIHQAILSGRLFAYLHDGRVKIGYFDAAGNLFLSVDQRHERVITTIRNPASNYVERLLNLS